MKKQPRSGSATRELGMRQAPHGVTLLELLTVVIVVGILAALAVPQYFQAQERVRSSEALEALGAIRSSQWRYRSHTKGMTGTEQYTNVAANLDFDVRSPSVNGFWTYNVCVENDTTTACAAADLTNFTAGTGPNAQATRSGSGAIIAIDLQSGNLCGMNAAAAVYALRPSTDC